MSKSRLQTSLVLSCLCLATIAAAAGDPPAFAPLKVAARGGTTVASAVKMPDLIDPTVPAGPLGRIVTLDRRTRQVTVRENVSRDQFLAEYGGIRTTGAPPGLRKSRLRGGALLSDAARGPFLHESKSSGLR